MDKKIFTEIVVLVKASENASVHMSFYGDYSGAEWEEDDLFGS